jgi:uncharacterized protein YhaN
MRIARLDLTCYGRFTDVSLPFPRRPSDIHVIYGPNEAGKSTSLAAIEDWLFGIEPRSPYNFLHDHARMRVGGVLEQGTTSLEVVRRKGNKDTLLSPEGTPLPAGDRALAPFLNAVTREFFTRMMSLDHERLTVGGREILEARNEVGHMLFAAGTGVTGLRGHLSRLEKRAEELWSPRRAAHRKYYEALDALEAAEKTQREQTVTATEWNKLKRAFDDAHAAYERIKQDIEGRAADQRKLSRIRRVYRRITQLAELEHQLEEIGEPAALPEEAEHQLSGAVGRQANAKAQTEVFEGQLAQQKAERADLQYDEAIILHAEAIERMHQSRIEVQRERMDLPKRQAERTTKESELKELAEGLRWGSISPDAIKDRLPPRTAVTTVRALLNERGAFLAAQKNAQGALSEAKDQLQELRDELDVMADVLDVSSLAATLSAARRMADNGSRIEATEREIKDSEARIQHRLQELRPPTATEQRLAEIRVPARAAVETHRDAVRQFDQRVRDCQDQLKAAERELAQRRRAYEQRAREHEGMAPETLRHARDDRETGWQLIRRRYIDAQEVAEPELLAFVGPFGDLPAAYETRVEAVDTLADRRFENAQAAGEMTVLEQQIEDQESELTKLREAQQDLTGRRADLESAWQALWAGAGFEPLSPDAMLEWLSTRAEILKLIESRETAQSELHTLREREGATTTSIVADMLTLGEPAEGLQGRALSVVIEQATAAQQRQETTAKERRGLQERIRKGEADVSRKAARLEETQGQWSDWQGRWNVGLTELGLPSAPPAETATEQINTLERMRTLIGEINQLRRDRIDKIEQDIDTFATAAAELVQAIDTDLAGRDPDHAIAELERRLESAKRIRERQRQMDQAIASLERRRQESAEARETAEQTIQALQAMAGVADPEQLREAIRRATRRGQLKSQRAGIETQLASDGDGLPLSELRQECAGVNLDQIASHEETVRTEIQALQEERAEAAERRQIARQAFEAVGGDSEAIRAAAARQEALASMRNVAERYVRTRTSATLLRWAIDRFRRERQAPLLKRAGRTFAELTSGSFTELRIEYDAEDQAQLAGIRPNRSSVGTSGMSDGTADQLYLALRLASIEEYLSGAEPLPLVADDLLVNFDDQRSRAALRVLAELARSTQVLFFTHHRHLVDIAKEALGDGVNVISLTDEALASAA